MTRCSHLLLSRSFLSISSRCSARQVSAQDNFCKEHVGNKRWGRLLKQGNTGTGCLLSLLVLKEGPGRKSTYYNLSISIWEYILDSSYGTAQSQSLLLV